MKPTWFASRPVSGSFFSSFFFPSPPAIASAPFNRSKACATMFQARQRSKAGRIVSGRRARR